MACKFQNNFIPGFFWNLYFIFSQNSLDRDIFLVYNISVNAKEWVFERETKNL